MKVRQLRAVSSLFALVFGDARRRRRMTNGAPSFHCALTRKSSVRKGTTSNETPDRGPGASSFEP